MIRTALLALLLALLVPVLPAADANLATVAYAQGSNMNHCVGALAVTVTEQTIVMTYQPGELTVVEFVASSANTTNLKIRDVAGDDTTSYVLAPGQTKRVTLKGAGTFTWYVVMASSTGTMSVTRIQ